MRFSKKTVAITGAGSGIGKETAIRFAEEGADVAVMDINYKHAVEVHDICKEKGTDPLALDCDVSKVDNVKKAFARIKEKYGKLDILFSNAGIVKSSNIEDMEDDEWQSQIDVNLTGTFYCNREAMRLMIPNKYGRIINMSSIWGGVSDQGSGVGFSASKAGIVGLTRALAKRAGKHGITVNAVSPGYIATPIHSPEYRMAAYAKITAETPVGRIGEPEDVAFLVLFLASDQASFISGQNMSPNGGLVV